VTVAVVTAGVLVALACCSGRCTSSSRRGSTSRIWILAEWCGLGLARRLDRPRWWPRDCVAVGDARMVATVTQARLTPLVWSRSWLMVPGMPALAPRHRRGPPVPVKRGRPSVLIWSSVPPTLHRCRSRPPFGAQVRAWRGEPPRS